MSDLWLRLRHKRITFRAIRALVPRWPLFILRFKRHRRLRQTMTVRLRNGLRFVIRPWTQDFAVLNETFREGSYVRRDWELPPRPVIVDIGAYIGDFALQAAEHWPGATIYAFEPNPDNLAMLRLNVERNSGGGRIRIFPAAIGGSPGRRTLSAPDPDRDSGGFSFSPHRAGKASMSVDVTTLSECVPGQIDLLKMDCEGGEYEILEGLVASGEIARIRAIALEWHGFRGEKGYADLMRCLGGFRTKSFPSNAFWPNPDLESGIVYAWREDQRPVSADGTGPVKTPLTC